MHLKSLYLRNFRCYKESYFEFCKEGNFISGKNAIGKTTILEAIYFLITGHSFRASQLSDLIQLQNENFYLEGHFLKHDVEQTLKISWGKKEKSYQHNSTKCPPSSLLGLLQGVAFTPEDISLVRGSPQIRRRFLDLHIAQQDPLYVHHLTRYFRAMRQRNALLKSKIIASIEVWEHEMANSAAYLGQQRKKAVNELEINSKVIHSLLTDHQEKLCLHYKSSISEMTSEKIKAQYQQQRKKEMYLGATLIGPHKDDLTIAIGEKEARFFASEGQQRSCIAALKFAEWQRLYKTSGLKPFMLIDDIGVSLDQNRRKKLLEHLPELGQTFLTSTEKIEFSGSFSKEIYL